MINKNLDFDFVTDELLIGKTPKQRDYAKLSELGVRLIINMRAERYAWPVPKRATIKTIWVPTIDHKLLPIKARRIARAAELATATIEQGNKVYVYCRAGRHRSVMMVVSILIAQGYSVDAAMAKVKSQRLVADPEIAHIRKAIVDFSDYWNSTARPR